MAYQFTQTGQEIQYLLDEAMQLAEEYDSSVSYAVGDYCSHEGTLYRCTTATTGTWDASKWTSNVIVLNALKTLKGRMDTAESEIDAAQEDITALNLSLATGVTRVDVSNTYASVVNWYSVVGKFVVGVIQVTPNQTINISAGEFNGGVPYPPYVDISLALHSYNTIEQKIQYAVLRANGQIVAYGAYTANVPVRAAYVYRMLN